MKDYLVNELIETIEDIGRKFKKVEVLKMQLEEQEQFEQVEIIGAREVAEMYGMSSKWAENLIRDIKKKEGYIGAGNKIPKSALLRAIGHTERKAK